MDLSSLHKKIWKRSRERDVIDAVKAFAKKPHKGRGDYLQEMADGGTMYCYLYAATNILKPKQIVEMGADCGASTWALHAGYPKSKIYSVESRRGAWEYITTEKGVTKIEGNYMDMETWPKRVDLKKTDMWFIDGNHALDHVRDQIDMYQEYFKKGAYLMFDDTKMHMGAFENRKFEWILTPEVHGNEFIVGRGNVRFKNTTT